MATDTDIKLYRERFFARQDVYGRKNPGKDGKRGTYYPVCNNAWVHNSCLLKTKGGTCATCKVKAHDPVTDEVIRKHINGEEEHCYYVLLPDDMIRFGAIDFDCKPGKEDKGHTFEDVKNCSQVLDQWGVPHGIARSTTDGYHLYVFIDDFYPANKFRQIMFEVYHVVGFMEERLQGIRPIPELFPKQQTYDVNGIGNGIKTPMIEPRWEVGRNGWVTKTNEFVAPDKQWEFFKNIPSCPASKLDEIIEEKGIKVDSVAQKGSKKSDGSSRNRFDSEGRWQPPMRGDIHKIMYGCKALRSLKSRLDKGEQPSHDEGMALFHFAMHTQNGIEWFTSGAVPGWGQTEKDIRQLKYSTSKNYAPHTCKKMQELGICAAGTKCFNKKPPVEQIEGQTIIRKDLPKEQWPEPSPIRYALGRGEDFLLKLQEEMLELKSVEDFGERDKKAKEIFDRLMAFDDDQQKSFKEFVKSKKIMKMADFNRLWAESEDAKSEELDKAVEERSDTLTVAGETYFKLEHGYSRLVGVGRKKKPVTFSDITFDIKEERIYRDTEGVQQKTRVYAGVAKTYRGNFDFEVDTDTWSDTTALNKYLHRAIGSEFMVLPENVKHLRNAAMAFSIKEGLKKNNYFTNIGWYTRNKQLIYLMPSYYVDKEGVKPNTEHMITIENKPIVKQCDFTYLSESELVDVLFHLKTDFLNAWPRKASMLALPHTFLPVINKALDPVGEVSNPTLYCEGTTGTGKTELTNAIQYFWGDFKNLLSLNSTAKSAAMLAHEFKDCLLTMDDFKGITPYQKKAVTELIQYSYNRSERATLNINREMRVPERSRATLCMSGEEFIDSQASAVARTIMIEMERYDTKKTINQFRKVRETRGLYKGVTPKFIHWFLGQNFDDIREERVQIEEALKSITDNKQNEERISYNLSLNHLCFRYFCHFMQSKEVVGKDEMEKLVQEHWRILVEVKEEMIQRCYEEQSSNVFLSQLRSLVATRKAVIEGYTDMNDLISGSREVIGFVLPGEEPLNVVYVHPKRAFDLVVRESKTEITGNITSIARQLVNDGAVMPHINQHTGQVKASTQKRYKRERLTVWVMDQKALGIVGEERPEARGTEVSEIDKRLAE